MILIRGPDKARNKGRKDGKYDSGNSVYVDGGQSLAT